MRSFSLRPLPLGFRFHFYLYIFTDRLEQQNSHTMGGNGPGVRGGVSERSLRERPGHIHNSTDTPAHTGWKGSTGDRDRKGEAQPAGETGDWRGQRDTGFPKEQGPVPGSEEEALRWLRSVSV